ncbi:MAG: hypothetical protein GY849_10060 [Deltaproteobacteria bacterium]|nr:hypothetical protein [Deltaproteobacteria bacterium]
MEFFTCPCPERGDVVLDSVSQGSNKDQAGNIVTKQCNTGLHKIALKCHDGKKCDPAEIKIEICNTDPISPMEVPFKCA